MLQLMPIDKVDPAEVLRLSVTPDQLPYVGTTAEILNDETECGDYHVVVSDGKAVGFFIIDTTYSQRYEFAHNSEAGLRAFLIDQRQQGKGYGKKAAALLKDYLPRRYPQFSGLALSVNCKNQAAYNCYKSAGFSDTGELYHGGPAGPQHIMRLKLRPARPA